MANDEYPIDENMQRRRDGGIADEISTIREVLRHRSIDPETGKVVWTFDELEIKYRPKE